MRLTALEVRASWGRPLVELAEIERRLEAGPPTDLVLLPEQALNGYVSPNGDFDLSRYAEPVDGPMATACADLARRRQIHFVAPLVLREGEHLYNAMLGFDPNGARTFVYRKRHPWFPEQWATAGAAPMPVVELGGLKVAIAICYDLQYILRGESHAQLAEADVLLFPSAWVEEVDRRAKHLTSLATRFGLYAVNANWASGAVNIGGQGASCIAAPDGAVTALPRTAKRAGRVDVAT